MYPLGFSNSQLESFLVMSYHGCFDTVKADEFTALRQCHSIHKFRALVHIAELFAAFMIVILLTWHPAVPVAALGAAGDCLHQVTNLFSRTVSIFLMSNAIVAAVIVLSSGKGTGGSTFDVYDEYLSSSRHPGAGRDFPMPEMDKSPLAAPAESQVGQSRWPGQGTESAISQVRIATTVKDEKQEQPASEREPCGGLSRSESSDTCQETSLEGEESKKGRSRSVEDLSTEEFNQAVEKYIAKTMWLLRKERLEDLLKNEFAEPVTDR